MVTSLVLAFSSEARAVAPLSAEALLELVGCCYQLIQGAPKARRFLHQIVYIYLSVLPAWVGFSERIEGERS